MLLLADLTCVMDVASSAFVLTGDGDGGGSCMSLSDAKSSSLFLCCAAAAFFFFQARRVTKITTKITAPASRAHFNILSTLAYLLGGGVVVCGSSKVPVCISGSEFRICGMAQDW